MARLSHGLAKRKTRRAAEKSAWLRVSAMRRRHIVARVISPPLAR